MSIHNIKSCTAYKKTACYMITTCSESYMLYKRTVSYMNCMLYVTYTLYESCTTQFIVQDLEKLP